MASPEERLHPDCLAVVRAVEAWGETPLTVDAMRALERRRAAELAAEPLPMARTETLRVPVDGGEIDVQLAFPHDGPFPGVLVWFHGGGFVIGAPELSADQTSMLAAASGCVVASVDYRLAPEHPFPTPPEDCYAALRRVADELDALAPGGRVAVGGDSAGGNLAAAVALLARDRGGPSIAFQLLVYPALSFRRDAPSQREFAEGYWLSAEQVDWFWERYVPAPADGESAYASPLLAPSLQGLPPALIVTAECDPLRDEGEDYARRLRDAGVACELRRYDGMFHGFMAAAGRIARGRDALRESGEAVGAALAAGDLTTQTSSD